MIFILLEKDTIVGHTKNQRKAVMWVKSNEINRSCFNSKEMFGDDGVSQDNHLPYDGGFHAPIIGDQTELLPGERIIHPDYAETSEVKAIYESSKEPCFDVPVSDNFAMAQFKKNTD